MRKRSAFVPISCLTVSAAYMLTAARPGLSPGEERGRTIFLTGKSRSGRKPAASLGPGTEVPASLLPCGSCHGADGRGRREGGEAPPDITWENLTRPYRVSRPGGREHPPYTEWSLNRAIATGIDPAGIPLRPVMPRYRMNRADMRDLISYLKKISVALDPGLTLKTIRIGCILPGGNNDPIAAAVRSALTFFFDEVNRGGGVYDRTIEAVFQKPENTATAFRTFLEDPTLFAFVGSFPPDEGSESVRRLSRNGIPVVAAGPLFPQLDPIANKSVFYLDGGLIGQIASLARFANARFATDGAHSALIYPDESAWREAASAIAKLDQSRFKFDEFPVNISQFDMGGLSKQLNARGERIVYLMLPGAVSLEILRNRSTLDFEPAFLIPGSLFTAGMLSLPPRLTSGVYFGFPTLPSDQYATPANAERLSAPQREAQRRALSTARILLEAVKRVGRDLSRDKLIAALESLYEFPPGFTPPVTFGLNRRAGAITGHILALDNDTRELIEIGRY